MTRSWVAASLRSNLVFIYITNSKFCNVLHCNQWKRLTRAQKRCIRKYSEYMQIFGIYEFSLLSEYGPDNGNYHCFQWLCAWPHIVFTAQNYVRYLNYVCNIFIMCGIYRPNLVVETNVDQVELFYIISIIIN